MAVKEKTPRKVASAKAAKKAAETKLGGNGKKPKAVAMGRTDDHPDQKPLEGMEEDRVVEIESCVTSIVNNKTRIKEKQEENKELSDELVGLMHQHGLTSYRCAGRVVTIIAGEEVVQIKKAKASKSE